MTIKTIAIIGAGNMGSCLLGGLIANDYPADHLWVSSPSVEKLTQLQAEFKKKFHITTDNIEASMKADVILLTVKPLVLPHVAKECYLIIQQKKPLIISTAAGANDVIIQHFLHGNIPIVRAMPNIPALVGCGATALFANSLVSMEQRNIAESIFRAVGITTWVDRENQLDAITALSGSGPAYFFLIMEAMQSAGEALGLPKEIARLFTLQTAYGATRMALESDKSVEALRAQVTSKGGSTEQAVRVLEEGAIRPLFSNALSKAHRRTEELAAMLIKKMEES